MTEFTVYLFPEGDEGSGFRTRNEPGEKFRGVLVNTPHRSTLSVRGSIVEIRHGTLAPDGNPASLLVFEFRFQSGAENRRFRNATITVRFSDANAQAQLDPEVYRIAPDKSHRLHKTVTPKEITRGVNASLNVGTGLAGGALGFQWEVREPKAIEHSARLSGRPMLMEKDFGRDNAAEWSMEEHTGSKDGIPTFLRTAVLLQRRADLPFRMTLQIESKVDFVSGVRRLFGLDELDEVDPVEIDPTLEQSDGSDLGGIVLEHLDGLDLGSYSGVTFATPMDESSSTST